MNTQFSRRLRAWQGPRTDAEAAALLGVNLRTWHNWKSGRYVPRDFVRRTIEAAMAAGPEPAGDR